MKRIPAPVLICLLLALSMALGGVAAGRAAGMAAAEVSLTRTEICADAGPQTVHISRDGVLVHLPACAQALCESCLQAGSTADLSTPFAHEGPRAAARTDVLPGTALHHPDPVTGAHSRAPPPVPIV